ncbi:DUF4239 domain-containing protein [bacterium]|nr:DUF4239 domain-containing protein [bacterium]
MFFWIYDIPTWKLVVLVTGVFVGATWASTIFIRPILRAFIRSQSGVNDIVSYMLGSHGVYFGILIGLLALSAYDNLNSAQVQVTIESARLAAIYRDVSTYPEPFRDNLQSRLKEYTRYVIDEAWPLQRKGLIPRKGSQLVTQFHLELTKFEPKTPAQEILHAEALSAFNSFIEARRLRLYAVGNGIPMIMWYVVFIGAVTNIVLVLLLDMKLLPHLFFGAISTFFLATLIAFVAAMDNPFRGEVSISPRAFELVYEDLMSGELQSESPPSSPDSK